MPLQILEPFCNCGKESIFENLVSVSALHVSFLAFSIDTKMHDKEKAEKKKKKNAFFKNIRELWINGTFYRIMKFPFQC